MALSKETEISLDKIADSLLVDLTVKGGDVKGSRDVSVTTSLPGLSLKLRVKAKKMFSYGETGVLFHLAGNLYVMVAHNPLGKVGASSAFLIDAAKCEDGGVMTNPEKLVARKLSLKEAVDNLGSSIVASFYRKNAEAWAPLTLAK